MGTGYWAWTQENTDQLISVALSLPFCVLMTILASLPRTIFGKIFVVLVTGAASLGIIVLILHLMGV